jgi:hypothetical protein
MSYLRDILKCHAPDLHAALEKAWKVAIHDVFPVLSSSDESLNSFPHSQNLENYLDSIYSNSGDICLEDSPYYLSPLELYCILMAILFHDIGRIQSEKGHGSFSRMYIKKYFEKFYISRPEIADIIGDICDFHKSLSSTFRPESVLLDSSMGKVRTRELSELLILIDEMDTSYLRLKSLYVLERMKYITGKAIFRNYIKGVSYSHKAKCIIVSLDDKLGETTDTSLNLDDIQFSGNSERLIQVQFQESNLTNDLIEFLRRRNIITIGDEGIIRDIFAKICKGEAFASVKDNELLTSELNQRIDDEPMDRINEPERSAFIENLKIITNVQNRLALYYLYKLYLNEATGEFFDKVEKEAIKKWPLLVVVPSVFRAIMNCERQTEKLKYLNRIGIHVRQWLIYYKEHLYDFNGKERIEPVLDFPLLKKVVRKMWAMSSQSFGDSWFTFTDLASRVHKKDLDIIVMAVQRIEVISRECANKKKLPYSVTYDRSRWCWIREGAEFVTDVDILCILKNMERVKENELR